MCGVRWVLEASQGADRLVADGAAGLRAALGGMLAGANAMAANNDDAMAMATAAPKPAPAAIRPHTKLATLGRASAVAWISAGHTGPLSIGNYQPRDKRRRRGHQHGLERGRDGWAQFFTTKYAIVGATAAAVAARNI